MAGISHGDMALVTGGASGIGRGMARALARESARAVLKDVSSEAGRYVAAETGEIVLAADLSQLTAYNGLFDVALAALGSIYVFVHCAAPSRKERQTAMNVSTEQWDEMVNVTLRSGFLLTQAVGQHMRDPGVQGRMLFLTSHNAETPRNLPHYIAARAGQTMGVKEVARALGPHGSRVNAALEAEIAMGRSGTPEDSFGMAAALLSDRYSGT